MKMNLHAAVAACVEHVRTGGLYEAEVSYTIDEGDVTETMIITVRKSFAPEPSPPSGDDG